MIIILEDDKSIRELVLYALEKNGFKNLGFSSVIEFEKYLELDLPDLILLDIMLPEKDGLEILKEIKSNHRTSEIPVIMLTAKSEEYDKLIGLDIGADDYVTKPFSIMELIARIKTVLRRCKKVSSLEFYGIKIYDDSHIVKVDETIINLTLKEYELLKLLIMHRSVVLSRNKLLNSIWGYDFDGETRTVDVHIRSLRKKLGSHGKIIKTIRGVGYQLGGESAEKN